MNLFLRVGKPINDGPRAGYHPVRSWMHAIDLHDTLTFEHSEMSSLETRCEKREGAAVCFDATRKP